MNAEKFDTFILVLPQTLMIEGGTYHYSLEELCTLQTIAESKVIRYTVFTFDFGSKILRDLRMRI